MIMAVQSPQGVPTASASFQTLCRRETYLKLQTTLQALVPSFRDCQGELGQPPSLARRERGLLLQDQSVWALLNHMPTQDQYILQGHAFAELFNNVLSNLSPTRMIVIGLEELLQPPRGSSLL